MCLNTCLKAFFVSRTACSMAGLVSYGLSPWRPRSDSGLVHLRHVVDKAVMRQVSVPILPLFHLSIIPPVPLTHHHFYTPEKGQVCVKLRAIEQ